MKKVLQIINYKHFWIKKLKKVNHKKVKFFLKKIKMFYNKHFKELVKT
jgi:hypothetical protein